MANQLSVALTPISCDYETAGALTGHSKDTIRRAVEAGELEPHYVNLGPRQVAKPVVMGEDLYAWVKSGAAERVKP